MARKYRPAKYSPERETLVVLPPPPVRVVAEPVSPALDFKSFYLVRLADQAVAGEMSDASKRVVDVMITALEFVKMAQGADPRKLYEAMEAFDRRVLEFRESVLTGDAKI